jgi:two-component system, OmpR family, response regulator
MLATRPKISLESNFSFLSNLSSRRFPMAQVKCRILCIDDHEDTSEMLKLLLAQEDYEVMTAVTMQEAIELATSNEFDLYVFDKHLPDGSGLDLCARLNEATPSVPCIFYTGDAYDIHKFEALAAGADDYVAKPDIDGLIESVRKLLSERECAAAS